MATFRARAKQVVERLGGVHIYRAVGDPRAVAGGGVYLQTTYADAGGNWGTLLPAGVSASDVTLIAADLNGNTSEMSPRP